MLSLLVACAVAPEPKTTGSAISSEGVSLSGQVTSLSGGALGGASLQACAEVCVAAISDGGGFYRFEGLHEGRWSIHAAGPSEEDAMLVIPWEISADSSLDIVIPMLGPEHLVPEAPSEIEVADDLLLTLSTDLLPGVPYVRAAALPGELWPPSDDLPSAPAVGWSLAPLGAGEAIPFEVTRPGEAWCSSGDGTSWEPCEGALPDLGSIVWIEG